MTGRTKLIIATVATAALLGVLNFVVNLNRPRIVGRAVSPEGVEMCVVQRFNWSGEPFFTTGFVYRKHGTNWGWLYYDHEDDYWGASRVVLDTNNRTAVFYRNGSPAVTFAWATEIYTLHRWNRTMTGAQDRLPVDWAPNQSPDRKR